MLAIILFCNRATESSQCLASLPLPNYGPASQDQDQICYNDHSTINSNSPHRPPNAVCYNHDITKQIEVTLQKSRKWYDVHKQFSTDIGLSHSIFYHNLKNWWSLLSTLWKIHHPLFCSERELLLTVADQHSPLWTQWTLSEIFTLISCFNDLLNWKTWTWARLEVAMSRFT